MKIGIVGQRLLSRKGFEYKITLKRNIDSETNGNTSESQEEKWPTSDILHISLYGSSGNADFQIEG
ncbi:hypothetical protein AVEN_67153-1, partial [Araneus ventricosus]